MKAFQIGDAVKVVWASSHTRPDVIGQQGTVVRRYPDALLFAVRLSPKRCFLFDKDEIELTVQPTELTHTEQAEEAGRRG